MRATVATLLACTATAAFAQDESGCGKFAWPVAAERAQLAASGKPVLEPGTAIARPGGAFVLRLQPIAQVSFPQPPERARNEGFGGYATGSIEHAGLYQVTLSLDAWLDVIQDGRYARSAGSSGRRDCPGLRKSVRFHLQAGPVVLQLSAVESDEIAVAIGPVGKSE